MNRRNSFLLTLLALIVLSAALCSAQEYVTVPAGADTLTAQPISVPQSLPPIVSPTAPEPYNSRANMVWIEGREITWTLPDASGRKRNADGTKRRAEGFFMDRTEVTNRQYAQFLSATDSNRVFYDPRMDIVEVQHGEYRAKLEREDYPIAWIDWTAAFAFARWAGKSLPTEDEWIIAALAGKDPRAITSMSSGSESPGDTNHTSAATVSLPGRTAVGSSPLDSTASGIRDLSGNVSEWTLSEETSAVPGGERHQWVVVKGGSYLDPPGTSRIFSRTLRDRTERLSSLGLRCILRERPAR